MVFTETNESLKRFSGHWNVPRTATEKYHRIFQLDLQLCSLQMIGMKHITVMKKSKIFVPELQYRLNPSIQYKTTSNENITMMNISNEKKILSR